MSTVYNLEPPPTAKVLLLTTSGDLLLELFAKQTPVTSRNFLQHCLDGYYNGTIFHRLVPGFIIQGGDPTNTGDGGESVYPGGAPFEDEFHSRLKYNRRGLLGMANEGKKGSNGSQFFLTLGETRELEGRNTLFGRVVGDTIYNLMKMGEAELETGGTSERPMYPTKVTGAEILVNPFEDMIMREVKAIVEVGQKQEGRKKGKKKGGKGLLSFGDEEGEDGMEEPVLKKEKFNTKLVSASSDAGPKKTTNGISKKPAEREVEKNIRRRLSRSKSPPRIMETQKEMQLPLPQDEEPSRSPSSTPEPAQVGKVSSLLDKTNAQIADLKASMKRNVQMAPVADTRKKSALEQMIPEHSIRGRKRKHNGDAPADKQTLDILNAFRVKLEQAPPEVEPAKTRMANEQNKQEGIIAHNKEEANNEGDEEANLCDLHFIVNCQSCQSWDNDLANKTIGQNDDDQGWLSHALSFEKDRLGKDLRWKRKNEEELLVIDPREKARDIREEQRAKKTARMGGSSAWDRDRNRGRLPDRRAGEIT